MAYSRTTWENSPSTNTPLSAANLNNIEQGILGVESANNALAGTVGVAMGTAGTAVNITSTQGSVTATQGSVAATQGSVVTLAGTVTTNTSNISSISGSVTNINASLGSVAGTVTTNTATIGSVAGTVSMGGLVFTNEAARDAAITSPTEGMRVYLTAPTIPAATGDVTAVPTGITTIYNGSAWVCVTPVSAYTVASGQTTSFSSWTPTLTGTPGANPSITLSTGTTALISTSCLMSTSSGNNPVAMSVAVSGTTTLTPSDAWRIYTANGNTQTYGATFVITGLTAGSNTFTLNYRVIGITGATLTVQDRRITVQGLA